MQIRTLTIAVALSALYALAYAQEPAAPPRAPIDTAAWEETERELMGQRCVNEGTWNTVDCALITHIAVRLARSEGVDLRTWLITHHGRRSLHPERHIPQTDSLGRTTTRLRVGRVYPDGRPWIGDLNDECREPQMWSWRNTMPWASGCQRWTQILAVVDGVLAGSVPDPSHGRALIWGGPDVDSEHIQQRVEEGFVILPIRGASNTYLGRP